MSAVRRHLRLWRACATQAVRRDLQFRTQTALTVAATLLEIVLSLLPVLILTSTAGNTTGWTGGLAIAVVGAFTMSCAVVDAFVAPNLARMDEYVREGELDLVLMRPVSAQLLTTLRWIRPAELGRLPVGAAMLVVGLATSGASVTASGLFAGAGWMVIGVIAWSLLWANLSYAAFWFQASGPVVEIANGLRSAGQYPRAYFARGPRLVFTAAVPALVLGALPVEAMLGGVTGAGLAVGVGALAVAGGITRLHWTLALRRYESASS